jgi:DNA primase
VYDAFRDRLMFPVIDVRGNVIGFSGRMLSDGEPKYLNSPETLVFNKSRNLFALNIAKKSKSGMLILSEGNIDVVALHQAGFDCAVASLGTSLTEEQARLMARYTENVVIAFDGDAAGVKASDRAITILDRAGLGVKVLRMRDAKDPDEFIQKFGADAFRRLLTESENHIAYRLLEIQSKSDLKSDEGRLEYFGTATKLLSELGNSAEREVYGRRVAAAAGVSFEAVEAEVKKLIKARRSSDNKKRRREELNPIAAMQPTDRSLRYENGYSAIAEEGVIGYLIADPSLIKTARAQGLDEGEFTSELLRKVYAWLLRRDSEDADVRLTTLLSVLEKPEAARITQIVQRPLSTPNGEKAIADYIGKIRTERLKSKPASTDDLMEMRRRYKETKGLEGEINGL